MEEGKVYEKDILDPSAAALERVKVEKAELEEKIKKLQAMLDKQYKLDEPTIADHSLCLMAQQLDAMVEYDTILNKRIIFWGM